MTTPLLPHLEKLLAAATPGPWEATEGCAVFADGSNLIADTFMSGADHPGAQGVPMPWTQPQCVANAAAIAATMNAAPALIRLARAAESWRLCPSGPNADAIRKAVDALAEVTR